MRRLKGIAMAAGLAVGLASPTGSVRAGDPGKALGISPYFAAPGLYGTAWGSPGYGSIRTTTKYSSPYGVGYGYGYGPTSVVPGRFGAGLWRPGSQLAQDRIHGGTVYSTFAVRYRAADGFGPPGIGVYAPAFGPPFAPVGRYDH